jgi:hypothetical protein
MSIGLTFRAPHIHVLLLLLLLLLLLRVPAGAPP